MATTRKRKTVTITNKTRKSGLRDGMNSVLDNVEDVVDLVSFRLWELTR